MQYSQETFLKELTTMTAEELNKIIEENGKVKLIVPFNKINYSNTEVTNNGRSKDNE